MCGTHNKIVRLYDHKRGKESGPTRGVKVRMGGGGGGGKAWRILPYLYLALSLEHRKRPVVRTPVFYAS